MIPDLNILKALLQSIHKHSNLTADYDPKTLNAHRLWLLQSVFISNGVGSTRDYKFDPVIYDLGPLTILGEQFVTMSTDEDVWNKVLEAYEAADCDWSDKELYENLQVLFQEKHSK